MRYYQIYKEDFRKNWLLAWPIMVGQLGQIAVNFVDNIMVGRLGPESLAAISLSIAIYISLFVTGMGISFALPPLVSAADGQGRSRQISQYFKHSLVINIAFAIFSIVVIYVVALPVMPFLGQEDSVVALAIPYLEISAWTMIPLMIFQTLRCYSEGMSETKPPMIAILVGNVINILLNYMLIFGKWGAPPMGVSGAALGTLIARMSMILVLIVLLYNWQNLWHHIQVAKYFTYQKKLFLKILKLGVPTGLQLFFEVSAFGGAAMIMGTLGAYPQAAHQIAINLASITFLICTGIGMAATIRVGNQLGKHNYPAIRRVGVSAMIQVFVFMIIGAGIFVVFRHQLPLIYIDDLQVIEIAALLLVMAALFQVSDGIQVVALGALRGLQDVKVPSLITFISYWIFGLPISYLSARYFKMGPIGVWIGLIIGLTISALLLTIRFFRLTARRKSAGK